MKDGGAIQGWPKRWAGKRWAGGLLERDLEDLYFAIPSKPDMCAALQVSDLADRRADRALQMLRRAGLTSYNRKTRLWERTHPEGGRGDGAQ